MFDKFSAITSWLKVKSIRIEFIKSFGAIEAAGNEKRETGERGKKK